MPVRALINRTAVLRYLDRMGPAGLILIPVLIQIAWKIVTDDEEINHTFFFDGYAHGIYFEFFLLGYLIGRREPLWDLIIRLRWPTLIAGVCTYAGLLSLWWVFNRHEWQGHLAGVTASFNQWFWLLAVMGWGARLLNKPYAWIRYGNNAVYPWYIFHQTIIIIAAYFLAPLALGGALEASLVITATFAGCFLITHFVIGRSRILKPLFGMR